MRLAMDHHAGAEMEKTPGYARGFFCAAGSLHQVRP